MKRVFGEQYVDLVSVIQELLNEVFVLGTLYLRIDLRFFRDLMVMCIS